MVWGWRYLGVNYGNGSERNGIGWSRWHGQLSAVQDSAGLRDTTASNLLDIDPGGGRTYLTLHWADNENLWGTGQMLLAWDNWTKD